MKHAGTVDTVRTMEPARTAFLKHSVFATVILGVGAFMHGSFECEAASISVHGTFLLCGK